MNTFGRKVGPGLCLDTMHLSVDINVMAIKAPKTTYSCFSPGTFTFNSGHLVWDNVVSE